MVAQGAEAQGPIYRTGPGGKEHPVPGDEGLRRDTQRRCGDDNSEDPRKAQGSVEEPLRQEDGDLRNPEGENRILLCSRVGIRGCEELGN